MVQKKQKFKSAQRAIRKNKKTKKASILKRIWYAICDCAAWIWNGIKAIWKWLCSINLVGLLNLALLIAIIALFSMLITDITCCKHHPKAEIAEPVAEIVVPERNVIKRPTLPIKSNRIYSDAKEPVNVVVAEPDPVAIKQTPCAQNNTLMGDIIIDSRGVASVIKNNTEIRGNLYLQNMRKFVLPCNLTVKGNLFLRDLGMLQFCGKFNVSGNIYVSPRSSFGPLPYDAHIGGQIIL